MADPCGSSTMPCLCYSFEPRCQGKIRIAKTIKHSQDDCTLVAEVFSFGNVFIYLVELCVSNGNKPEKLEGNGVHIFEASCNLLLDLPHTLQTRKLSFSLFGPFQTSLDPTSELCCFSKKLRWIEFQNQ